MRAPLPIALALALGAVAPVAPAGAATPVTPDRVVAEAPEIRDVAADGRATAWAEADERGRVTAVLDPRVGRGGRRRFAAGIAAGEVTLGTDAAGRRVLVYTVCAGEVSCRLRRVDLRTRRSRPIAGIGGLILSPELARGRLAWIGSGGVLYRGLRGGRVRRQRVGGAIGLTGLDHDGRRLVVTGDVYTGRGNGATDLRLVRFGGARARTVHTVTFGAAYHVIRAPMLTGGHVDVVDALQEESATDVARISLRDGRRRRLAVGAHYVALAEGGGTFAYAMGSGLSGCPTGGDPRDEAEVAPASCRVVRTKDPFGARPRLLPRMLTIAPAATVLADGTAEVAGRLEDRTVRRGKVIARRGYAGAEIDVAVSPAGLEQPAFGPPARVVTDAEGRWVIRLAPDRIPRLVRAVTVEAPRAWSEDMAAVAPSP
ncbi:MAG TPA: hypothetical protein VF533_07250 [Solirubrobacteraceae bacterium]